MAKRIRRRTLKRNRKSIRSHKRRHTKKRTQKRNYKHKKHSFRRRYRKQYGGDFNKEQIEVIKQAMRESREGFTEEEIEHYMKKLNAMSQCQLRGYVEAFDDFHTHMMQHLDGEENRTFKQWIDDNYQPCVNDVATDVEENTLSDMGEDDF